MLDILFCFYKEKMSNINKLLLYIYICYLHEDSSVLIFRQGTSGKLRCVYENNSSLLRQLL